MDSEVILYEKKDENENVLKSEQYCKIKTEPGKDFGHCIKCCFFSLYKCDPCCDAPLNDERFSGCFSDGFIFQKLK